MLQNMYVEPLYFKHIHHFLYFCRLIKGDGEVIEEIVSRDRHKAINKQATSGDGNFFHKTLYSKSTTK